MYDKDHIRAHAREFSIVYRVFPIVSIVIWNMATFSPLQSITIDITMVFESFASRKSAGMLTNKHKIDPRQCECNYRSFVCYRADMQHYHRRPVWPIGAP